MINQHLSDRIIDSLNAVIILHDLELRVIFVNDAFEGVFGIPRSDALGRSPMEFLPEFDREHKIAIIKRLKNTIAKAAKSADHEFAYITPQGEYRYLSAVSIPIFDVDRRMTHVLSLINDLTKQKEDEKNNIKSAQFSYITDMAYTLAHEISNPLTGIKLGLSTLYDSLAKPHNIKVLDSVMKDLNRIQEIVNSILRNMKSRSKFETLDASVLSEMIDEVVFHFNELAKSKKINFSVMKKEIPAKITIDRDKIYQVLLNLVINAVDAVPEGGQIDIGLARSNGHNQPGDEGHAVILSVADNGVGLDNGVMEAIFNPFFSLKPDGTGLGLSICQQIIRGHGGKIRADSQKGQGTKVMVRLPIKND